MWTGRLELPKYGGMQCTVDYKYVVVGADGAVKMWEVRGEGGGSFVTYVLFTYV